MPKVEPEPAPARPVRETLPGGRRAGPHMPIGHGLVRAAERAAQIGAWSIQIFSDNPSSWRRRSEPPPEAEAFRRRLAELDIGPLAVHAAYLVNLAGSDPTLLEKSIEVLRQELELAPLMGARFVNVHAGSHRGSDVQTGVARLVAGIARVLAESPGGPDAPLIVIENSSGGGDGIGVTIEELALIDQAARFSGIAHRIRFCLDTAHLWGAGYDISEPEGVERLVAAFDRQVGLERLAMIHLNDTVSGLGSRHDHHTHLGEGRIGATAMTALLRHDILRHVTFYFETPAMETGYDAVNMSRLYDMATGRPLTPGPNPGQGGGATASDAAARPEEGPAATTSHSGRKSGPSLP